MARDQPYIVFVASDGSRWESTRGKMSVNTGEPERGGPRHPFQGHPFHGRGYR